MKSPNNLLTNTLQTPKISKSVVNLGGGMNKSMSGSSIDRLVKTNFRDRSMIIQQQKQTNKDIEVHLDTIKERLRRGQQRKKARN